jgi:uncharacterized protein with HEPN domain
VGLTREDFLANPTIRHAVAWNFDVVGEALHNLPDDLKARYPAVEWGKFAELRDAVVHGYFRVDSEVLWGVIEDDVPHFHNRIRDIIVEEELREAGQKR